MLHAQLAAALQLILHLRRVPGGRVLEEACLLLPSGRDGLVAAVPAWQFGRGPGPAAPHLADLFTTRGVRPPALLRTAGSAPC